MGAPWWPSGAVAGTLDGAPSTAPGEEGEHPSDPTPASGFLGRYCPITFISSQDTKQSPSLSSRPTPGHKAGAAAVCLLVQGRCTRPEDRLAVSVHACGDEEPQVGGGSRGTSRGQGVWRWGWGDSGRESAAGGGGTGGGHPPSPHPQATSLRLTATLSLLQRLLRPLGCRELWVLPAQTLHPLTG